jgi:hypothetical protein
MTEAGLTPAEAWPFQGRLVHAIGDQLLDQRWILLRSATGLRLMPEAPRLPDEMQDLLNPYRVAGAAPLPSTPGILGLAGLPVQLLARTGRLLSEFVLLAPLATELSKPDRSLLHRDFDALDLDHLKRVLFSALYRSEGTLSGVRWPLSLPPVVHTIQAELLPAMDFDWATDFCRVLGTDVLLGDLRFEKFTLQAAHAPTPPIQVSEPVPPWHVHFPTLQGRYGHPDCLLALEILGQHEVKLPVTVTELNGYLPMCAGWAGTWLRDAKNLERVEHKPAFDRARNRLRDAMQALLRANQRG